MRLEVEAGCRQIVTTSSKGERGSTWGVAVLTHSDFGPLGARVPAGLSLFVAVLTLFWVPLA